MVDQFGYVKGFVGARLPLIRITNRAHRNGKGSSLYQNSYVSWEIFGANQKRKYLKSDKIIVFKKRSSMATGYSLCSDIVFATKILNNSV
jgi:hypothetical protein